MPGIAGFLSYGSAPGGDNLASMWDALRHEPFYTTGHAVVDRLGLSVGWASHPGSFSDCLPIWNETRDIALFFTGETFAEPDAIQRTRAAGHQFSDGDASYLVHWYEESKDQFFERLNGVFSGLLVDLQENKAVLFNDRYGLSRIYYHESPEGVFFSSEAKSLLRVLPALRQLDPRGLGEYFSCGCVLQHRTLFPKIFTLAPASLWTFRPGRAVHKARYFQKESLEGQTPLAPNDYYERLKETFTRILPKYFLSREKIALSLTGGLDSRLIISAMPQTASPLTCYTVRGMYRECADARIGRRVAEVCGQPHDLLTVDRGFFRSFPDLARRTVYYTDGLMHVVGAAGLYACRQARQLAPVRLSGNYGGEVLRGLEGFLQGYVSEWMFDGSVLPVLRDAETTFAKERREPRTSFIVFKQVPWHHYSRFAMESSQLTVRSPYLDNELVRLAYQAPADLGANKAFFHRLVVENNPALAGVPTDRGRVRRPAFVPPRAWEWWKELGPRAEYAWDYGMPDWLAKMDHALSPLHLERLFLGIQKYCHFRTWYRHELAPFVKEVLLDPVTLSRPYWNGRAVEKHVMAHVNGTGNSTAEIHTLLTMEFAHRTLIDQQPV